LATKKERRKPLGEINIDFRLVFEIPGSRFTINRLIGRLKESLPQIQGTILSTLLSSTFNTNIPYPQFML